MPGFNHILYDFIRSLPLMLNADQACWCLGVSRATFFRRVNDGTIKQGKKLGHARRWEKAYILTIMGDDGAECGAPAPPVPQAVEACAECYYALQLYTLDRSYFSMPWVV